LYLMKINTYISIVIIFLTGMMHTLFIRKPSFIVQLGLLIIAPFMLYAFVYSVYSFIRGFFSQKTSRPLCFLPLLLIIVVFSLSAHAGNFLHHRLFHKCKPLMEQFVENLDDKESYLNSAQGQIQVPDELGDYIYGIHTCGYDSGKFEASFFFGGGFPVKHSAWYYSSDGTPPDPKSWPRHFHIQPNWYRVSD
jgi:hypothetical protein